MVTLHKEKNKRGLSGEQQAATRYSMSGHADGLRKEVDISGFALRDTSWASHASSVASYSFIYDGVEERIAYRTMLPFSHAAAFLVAFVHYLGVVWVSFFVPLLLGYDYYFSKSPEDLVTIIWFDTLAETVYVLVVLARLRITQVHQAEALELVAPTAVARYLARSPVFWVDILSGAAILLPRRYWLLRCARIFRLHQLPTDAPQVRYSPTVRGVVLSVEVLLGCHILTCAWAKQTFLPDQELTKQCVGFNVNHESGILRLHIVAFIGTLQWMFGNFSMTDSGIHCQSDTLLYACFLVLLGKFAFAYIFGTIHNLLSRIQQVEDSRANILANVDSGMKVMRLPAKLRTRILGYVYFMQVRRNEASMKILFEELSGPLKSELKLHIYHTMFAEMPFFVNMTGNVVPALINELSESTFLPGDFIIVPGMESREMFFVVEGYAQIVSTEGVPLVFKLPGDFFGEIGVITDSRRNAWARACTFCVVATLTGNSLLMVMTRFPDQMKTLVTNLQTVSQKTLVPNPKLGGDDDYWSDGDDGDGEHYDPDAEDSPGPLFKPGLRDVANAEEPEDVEDNITEETPSVGPVMPTLPVVPEPEVPEPDVPMRISITQSEPRYSQRESFAVNHPYATGPAEMSAGPAEMGAGPAPGGNPVGPVPQASEVTTKFFGAVNNGAGLGMGHPQIPPAPASDSSRTSAVDRLQAKLVSVDGKLEALCQAVGHLAAVVGDGAGARPAGQSSEAALKNIFQGEKKDEGGMSPSSSNTFKARKTARMSGISPLRRPTMKETSNSQSGIGEGVDDS